MENFSSKSSAFRWLLIMIFFFIKTYSHFSVSEIIKTITLFINVPLLFIIVFLHGRERYGLKPTVVFFLLTWLISNSLESLSIVTGFPFGHYYYDKFPGPRLFAVPIVIMLAYFMMGYVSWILSQVILGLYQQQIKGIQIFFIPLIATFIMVIWDVCMDPISSTVNSLWVWQEGGSYFGVPLQNYFGWFLVNYIIFQIFALYISKYYTNNTQKNFSKFFWLEPVAIYGIQAWSILLNPLTATDHLNIYSPIAMITIFTMVFITLISVLTINRDSYINAS